MLSKDFELPTEEINQGGYKDNKSNLKKLEQTWSGSGEATMAYGKLRSKSLQIKIQSNILWQSNDFDENHYSKVMISQNSIHIKQIHYFARVL